jgi:hypothetical protein
VKTRLLGGLAAGVSAASSVLRHGKYLRHVRRNVPQRRGDRTQRVRAGQGAAEPGTCMATVNRGCSCHLAVSQAGMGPNGPVSWASAEARRIPGGH